MSNVNYKTHALSLEEKRQLLLKAKAVCSHFWVDILDCSKSFARQRIDMPFEEIMAKLDEKCHFTVIHRNFLPIDRYLEMAFSTMTSPDYFLWIILDEKYIPEFTAGLPINQ